MTTRAYMADVVDMGKKPVVCGDCGWRSNAEQVLDVEDCILTPGDDSPVGRCPKCQSLCYVREKEHVLRDHAERLMAACHDGLSGLELAFPHAECVRDILMPIMARIRKVIADASKP